MARIRYLKPDFFFDVDVSNLPFEARLCFQGLWCHSDREGKLEDDPKRLKALIFPYDEIDMNELLQFLIKKPHIIRYQINGKRFIQIINFKKHQKPHHTEKISEIPDYKEDIKITVKQPLKDGEEPEGMEKGMGNGKGNGKGNGTEARQKISPALRAAFDNVFKNGLNVYALINKFKNKANLRADLPEFVLLGVCEAYLREKPDIKKHWPWFIRVLKAQSDDYFAQEQINESKEFKKPSAYSIASILSGVK